MKNHFKALVKNGFLAKANTQLNDAQAMIKDPFESSFEYEEDFMWYFDREEKKLDFDTLYDELDIPSFVYEAYDQGYGAEDDDVIIMNSFDFTLYCSTKKAVTRQAAYADYNENGVMPYFFTKRVIDGKVFWFCLSWLMIPFTAPNYN